MSQRSQRATSCCDGLKIGCSAEGRGPWLIDTVHTVVNSLPHCGHAPATSAVSHCVQRLAPGSRLRGRAGEPLTGADRPAIPARSETAARGKSLVAQAPSSGRTQLCPVRARRSQRLRQQGLGRLPRRAIRVRCDGRVCAGTCRPTQRQRWRAAGAARKRSRQRPNNFRYFRRLVPGGGQGQPPPRRRSTPPRRPSTRARASWRQCHMLRCQRGHPVMPAPERRVDRQAAVTCSGSRRSANFGLLPTRRRRHVRHFGRGISIGSDPRPCRRAASAGRSVSCHLVFWTMPR